MTFEEFMRGYEEYKQQNGAGGNSGASVQWNANPGGQWNPGGQDGYGTARGDGWGISYDEFMRGYEEYKRQRSSQNGYSATGAQNGIGMAQGGWQGISFEDFMEGFYQQHPERRPAPAAQTAPAAGGTGFALSGTASAKPQAGTDAAPRADETQQAEKNRQLLAGLNWGGAGGTAPAGAAAQNRALQLTAKPAAGPSPEAARILEAAGVSVPLGMRNENTEEAARRTAQRPAAGSAGPGLVPGWSQEGREALEAEWWKQNPGRFALNTMLPAYFWNGLTDGLRSAESGAAGLAAGLIDPGSRADTPAMPGAGPSPEAARILEAAGVSAPLGLQNENTAAAARETALQTQEKINRRVLERAEKSGQKAEALNERFAGKEGTGADLARWIGAGAGSMAPQIAAGWLGGPAASGALIFGQGMGDYYADALQDGATTEQAVQAGLVGGAANYGIEKAFGGIPLVGEGVVPVEDIVKRYVRSRAGRVILNRLAEATGEGAEEVMENYLKPIVQNMVYDKEIEWPTLEEQLDSFAGGFAASLVTGSLMEDLPDQYRAEQAGAAVRAGEGGMEAVMRRAREISDNGQTRKTLAGRRAAELLARYDKGGADAINNAQLGELVLEMQELDGGTPASGAQAAQEAAQEAQAAGTGNLPGMAETPLQGQPGAALGTQSYPQAVSGGAGAVSYDALAALPDMAATRIDTRLPEGASRSGLVQQGIANSGGKVVNRYTGQEMTLTASGLRHGIAKAYNIAQNGPYVLKAGEILQNAVKVNELEPRGTETRSDIYLGYAVDENGAPHAVRFVVNLFPNGHRNADLDQMEVYDGRLYAERGKIIKAASEMQPLSSGAAAGNPALNHRQTAVEARTQPGAVPLMSARTHGVSTAVGPALSEAAGAASAIKITDLLGLVKGQMDGFLSEDVRARLGTQTRRSPEFGAALRYDLGMGGGTPALFPGINLDQSGAIMDDAARQLAVQSGRVSETELAAMDRMAEAKGLRMRYIYHPAGEVDGWVSGDTITVNLASESGAFGTAVHEVGHTIKAADAGRFARFEQAVLRLAAQDAELGRYAQAVRTAYTAENSPARASLLGADGQLNEAAVNEEVALKLAEQLVGDPEKLTQAVTRERGLGEMLLDFIRGIKNSIAIRLTGSQKAMLDEAERTLVNLLRGEGGSVEGQRLSYIGEHAQLRDGERRALGIAQQMEQEGETAGDIRRQTGWFRGADGRWRMEIDDSGAVYQPEGARTLGQALEHPELYQRYPALTERPFSIDEKAREQWKGGYSRKSQSIKLSPDADIGTLLHETQHAIQDIEGFAGGGNRLDGKGMAMLEAYPLAKELPAYQQLNTPEERFEFVRSFAATSSETNSFEHEWRKRYSELAGEVEANDVKNRAAYSNTRREGIPPKTDGIVIDRRALRSDMIDMFLEMGYNKKEVAWLLEGGSQHGRLGEMAGTLEKIAKSGGIEAGGGTAAGGGRGSAQSSGTGGNIQAVDLDGARLSGEDGRSAGSQNANGDYAGTRRHDLLGESGSLQKDSLSVPYRTQKGQTLREYLTGQYPGMIWPIADPPAANAANAQAAPAGPVEAVNAQEAQDATGAGSGLLASGKSLEIQQRQTREFVDKVAEGLGVPRWASREFLRPIAAELAESIKTTGRIDPGKADELFNTAFEQGIVIQDEMVQQYGELKKELRSTALTLDRETREGKSYNEWRKQFFGALNLASDGMPVDVYYQELCERYPELFDSELTHPADQAERILEVYKSIRTQAMNLDAYYGDDAEDFKAWARDEFDRALEELAGGVGKVRRLEADNARGAQPAQEPPPPMGYAEVERIQHEAKKLQRQADRAMARAALTAEDKKLVDMLLAGGTSEDYLRSKGQENLEEILKVYQARKAVDDTKRPVKAYNAKVKEQRDARAMAALEGTENWTDKQTGMQYSMETMQRNIRDISRGDEAGRRMVEEFFAPVQVHEAAATRMKNEYRERIRKLGLNQWESAYTQIYGELEALDGVQYKSKEREHLAEALEELKQEHGREINEKKAREAVPVFRKELDALFAQINQALVENGYEPVEYRRGYFPHFSDSETDSLLKNIADLVGHGSSPDDLPTSIAGLTAGFKPGRRWNAHALERKGFETAYDALKGFDLYLEVAADVIHHTGDIRNLRALAEAIRYKYGDEGIREQIRRIRADEKLTESQRDDQLAQMGVIGKSHLSRFVQELDEYTNLLAGKKSRYDRAVEYAIGRGIYRVMNKIESKVGANMVAVNLGSWLTNFLPVAQVAAEVGQGNMLRAARDTVKNWWHSDGFEDRSDFLTNRAGSQMLSRSKLQRASDFLSSPMQMIDGFASNMVTRAYYYKNLREGMNPVEALQRADRQAAGLMADRSKGAMPTLFASKNPLTRMLTMFQLEPNNTLRHIAKDIPDMGDKASEIWGMILIGFVYSYIFDDLFELLTGRRCALDPLDIFNEAVGDMTGFEVPNLVEEGYKAVKGEASREDFTTQPAGIAYTVANTAKNLAQEVPFVGGLLGGGRLPVSAAFPDIGNAWGYFGGWLDGNKSGLQALYGVGKELAKPMLYTAMPLGGGQLKKTAEGLDTMVRGGYYKQGREGEQLQTAVDRESMWNWLKAITFGRSAITEVGEYYDTGRRGMTAEQTAIIKELGMTPAEGQQWLETFGGRADNSDRSNFYQVRFGEEAAGLDERLARMAAAGADGVRPSKPDRTLTVNGEDVELGAAAYRQYLETRANGSYELLGYLPQLESAGADDALQTAYAKRVQEYMAEVAREQAADVEPRAWVDAAREYAGAQGGEVNERLANAILARAIISAAKADKQPNGSSVKGSRKRNALAALEAVGFGTDTAAELWEMFG